MPTTPPFTVGIEEEYLLVDLETGDLVSDPPAEIMTRCTAVLGDQVANEFMRSQIEVGTHVCATVREAVTQLAEMRAEITRVGAEFGIAPMAASTHPFGEWTEQHHTDKERYNALAADLQAVVRRLVICGMHVHVGLSETNNDLRIDIMNQVRYFLPHLLALSTSSPFWQARDTGLKSYRLSVFDELPRTGMPPQFQSYGEYERTVGVLVGAGAIEDASRFWWDIRPHHTFPTLEMRICDVCTDVRDAGAIAALYVCLTRMLYRLRRNNQRWRAYPAMLINENRWRAQRYGIEAELIDFGRGEAVPFADLIDEMLQLVAEDAAALDCEAEVAHARTILKGGTSADRQRTIVETGGDTRAVVTDLVARTTA